MAIIFYQAVNTTASFVRKNFMSISLEIESVRDWLEGFAAAVRARDYELGRTFFANEVVGFGSVAKRCDGLQDLEKNQWRNVWGVTTGFEFDLDSSIINRDEAMAWAACSWQSFGKPTNGEPLLRRGRSTFVFRKENQRWLAVHSHFSLEPMA